MYVNFEKLYATMDRMYSHQDESKDLVGEFALVWKDVVSSRKTVRTEGECIKMFEAWRLVVVDLFPHRSLELERYRAMVIELFHMAPSEPQIAIQFNVDAREFYS